MCVRERERKRESERERETKSRFNPIQKCQLSLSYDEDTSGEELFCRLSGLPLISFGFIVDDEKLVSIPTFSVSHGRRNVEGGSQKVNGLA